METQKGRLSFALVSTSLIPLVCALFAGFVLPARAASLVAWGSGNGTNVPPGLGSGLVAIAAGQEHGLALTADGTVLGWGTDSRHQATNLTGVVSDATAIAAGYVHSLALKKDGTVVAWGAGSSGQLLVPADLTNVVAIAAGGYHNVALRRDGSVTNWGTYYIGGSPETSYHFPPNFTNIAAIAAGNNHDLLLQSNGTVLTFGEDGYGQCDQPGGLISVTAVAAGGDASFALQANGRPVGWGGSAPELTAVPANLTNATAVGVGYYACLAITSDGRLVTWGWNNYGQLSLPAGVTNAVKVAAGGQFSLALFGAAGVSGSSLVPTLNPTCAQGVFSVSVQTSSGKNYQLEYASSPGETNWTALSSTSGDGTLRSLCDTNACAPQGFYRVREQ